MPPIKLNPLSQLQDDTARVVTFVYVNAIFGHVEFCITGSLRMMQLHRLQDNRPLPDGWIPLVMVEE